MPSRIAAFKALCGAAWGISYRTRSTSALCDSVMYYAAPARARALRSTEWETLKSAQRAALLTLTRAYRTASTDAIQVLAARPPVDLHARYYCAIWELQNGINPCIPVTNAKEASDWLQLEWNRRWDASNKGRHTYALLPNISCRRKWKHIEPDYDMLKLLRVS